MCCMENTAQEGMSKNKYSMRQSQVLYLSQDMRQVLYILHISSGGALSGILYFELLLNCNL